METKQDLFPLEKQKAHFIETKLINIMEMEQDFYPPLEF